jgi:hypothetical protein
LQLFLSAILPKHWQAGTRIRYTTGDPYTPVTDRIYDATNRFYRPVYGSENSSRNGGFFSVDIRFDKRFTFNNWILNGYADISNIFWFLYKSPEFTMFNYDFTERTSISFPCIPSLGLRAEF